MEDRKITLLKATLDILKKVGKSKYVVNALETTAIWDDVECDGYCLMEEIEELLSSQPETKHNSDYAKCLDDLYGNYPYKDEWDKSEIAEFIEKHFA